MDSREAARVLCTTPPVLRPPRDILEAEDVADAFRARMGVALCALYVAVKRLEPVDHLEVQNYIEDVATHARKLHPTPADTHVAETLKQLDEVVATLQGKRP